MNVKLISALAAGLLATPGFAAAATLDFEGAPSFESIGDFYSGLGVSFGGDALALSNDELGPYYSHAPTPGTVMAPVGASATMDVATGFGDLSFAYSSKTASSVSLYSGLGGTGALIGTINLAANAQSGGCTDSPLCFWEVATLDFAGVARSIVFGNVANTAMFDNVNFAPVPLPAAAWLMMSALGGIGAWARRKRAA